MQAIAGGVLISSMWVLSWFGTGEPRYHTFFPLWLGYILLVDAIVLGYQGTSLIARLGPRSIYLFLISVPLWWVFEAANARLDNWSYLLPRHYSWLAYHAEASLAFSTVVPAVLVTAEMIRAFVIRGPVHSVRIPDSSAVCHGLIAAGIMMFCLMLLLPDVFFPLAWISLFFICDPLVALLGGRSITSQVRNGRWDTVLIIFIAALVCGFFWEMWNSRAMPKWEYSIPYAAWLHVFEMPILGYGGYLPFGLEIYALTSLVDRLFNLRISAQFRFDRSASDS